MARSYAHNSTLAWMKNLYLHSNIYGSATAAGIVMLAMDAGAELLGLPSVTALPALALALEMGLEAAS